MQAKKIIISAAAAVMAMSAAPTAVFADTAQASNQASTTASQTTQTQDQNNGQTGQQTGDQTGDQTGEQQNGWVTDDAGTHYYKDGTAVTGVQKIDGKLYAFDDNGIQVKTPGLQKITAGNVYVKKDGTLQTKFVADGNNAYYFYPSTGLMAKNTKIKYLKIPKSGNLGKAYALGIKQLNKSGWSLKKAFNYSAKLKYANRSMRKKTSEDYAIVGFTKGKGNCYVMAATFYVQAKLLGYDVHQISGKVDRPHSWTEIRQGKKTYVYDPNFTNETKHNGYKIRYKQHGTWRYHIIKRMN